MAKRTTAKKEIVGVRLAVLNPNAGAPGQDKWLEPAFSFNSKTEAHTYREQHWPSAKVYRVWFVRLPASFGIPEDFYFKSLLSSKEKVNAAK